MSQETVEVARRSYDAFNRRDLDALLALMDEDVEGVTNVTAVEGSYHGHEGIARWWRDLLDAFPDLMVDVLEMRDCGDLSLAQLRFRGHGAGSGIPFDVTVWHVSHGREGKCIWWHTFQTEAEALEAVRLRT